MACLYRVLRVGVFYACSRLVHNLADNKLLLLKCLTCETLQDSNTRGIQGTSEDFACFVLASC